jgi:hypothetical protein
MIVEPQSAIYDVEKIADIEFYTPDPLGDIRDVCDRLYAMGFTYVQGREAAHLGTFTISVDFKRICDVTYAPIEVFRAIPTLAYNNGDLLGVHPGFAMIDMLRMLSDPFTSHWKLDKTLPRLLLAQRLFPILLQNSSFVKYAKGPSAAHVLDWVSKRSTLVAVGELAALFYEKDEENDSLPAHLNFVSVDFEEDVSTLALAFPDYKLIEEYGLMDMIGRTASIRFIDGSSVTLTDANGRSIPCRSYSFGTKIASFTYTLASALSMRFAGLVRKNGRVVRSFDALITRLIQAKTEDPKFGESNLNFLGEPTTAMRRHMLATDERRLKSAKGAPVWLSYDPKEPRKFNDIKGKYHLLRWICFCCAAAEDFFQKKVPSKNARIFD